MQELHVWQARLDADGWPGAGDLPSIERDRAAAIQREDARHRWVVSRWALRRVLAGYLEGNPAEIELRFGSRGKPMLAKADSGLRFNLSHSGELALIAVAGGAEVQRIGSRRPPHFYSEWTRREAIAKCHGTGLWAPLPDAPVAVSALDVEQGFAASVAFAGTEMPALRQFDAKPRRRWCYS
jgi:phosphopantetheinyl transferase